MAISADNVLVPASIFAKSIIVATEKDGGSRVIFADDVLVSAGVCSRNAKSQPTDFKDRRSNVSHFRKTIIRCLSVDRGAMEVSLYVHSTKNLPTRFPQPNAVAAELSCSQLYALSFPSVSSTHNPISKPCWPSP